MRLGGSSKFVGVASILFLDLLAPVQEGVSNHLKAYVHVADGKAVLDKLCIPKIYSISTDSCLLSFRPLGYMGNGYEI